MKDENEDYVDRFEFPYGHEHPIVRKEYVPLERGPFTSADRWLATRRDAKLARQGKLIPRRR